MSNSPSPSARGTVNSWVIISDYLLIHHTNYLPVCNVTHSGNRSSKTFKPKKNIPEGSHQYELLKHAEATLGSGNLRMAVMLPEGEDLNEWVAVNSKHQFDLFYLPYALCWLVLLAEWVYDTVILYRPIISGVFLASQKLHWQHQQWQIFKRRNKETDLTIC